MDTRKRFFSAALHRLYLSPIGRFVLSNRLIKACAYKKTKSYLALWYAEQGDDTLMVNYPLNQSSVVFDLGGYVGDWSGKIEKKYNPRIFIFEPVPEHILTLQKKFQHNPKIRIHPWGLAHRNFSATMSMEGAGSSVFKKGRQKIKAEFKDVKEFMEQNDFGAVDLIKINIEGGEYQLLQRMIETRIIDRFKNIVIQFHDFYPRAFTARHHLQKSLSATHFQTWNYPFVFENWKLCVHPV